MSRLGWALLAVYALLLAQAAPAGASEDLRLSNLRVDGGEDRWHAQNGIALSWDLAGAEAAPVASLYQLHDSTGAPVGPLVRRPGQIQGLRVELPAPGRYLVEVRLEGAGGETGPAAMAALLFDDVAPAAAVPVAPTGWVMANEPVVVEVRHPPQPLPISGIDGYALSVDRGQGSDPCGGQRVCAGSDLDLGGGIDDDRASLGTLPEGVNFVRAVAVSGSGVRSSETLTTEVLVDGSVPQVALSGIPSEWVQGPVLLTATASDPLSGMAAAGPDGPFTAIALDGGAPRMSPGSEVDALVTGEGVHTVAYFARDAAGNIADGSAGAPAPATGTVRIDETGPQLSFQRSQDPADPELIEASVRDALSGPQDRGGSISVRPAHSHLPFRELPTSSSPGRLVARWDSEAYQPGSYEFVATAFDRAGNRGSGTARADGSPMILPSPLKGAVTIESGFGGATLSRQRCTRHRGRRRCHRRRFRSFEGRPGRMRVAYGHGVLFGGCLRGPDGAPLADRAITVTEEFAGGAMPLSRSSLVRTGPDGTFYTRLAPGPSRSIAASFDGTRTLAHASGRTVSLGVLSSVTLRASSPTARIGGAPVTFSGRVGGAGARFPAGGRPVELQFRYPGASWSQFRMVQTDRRGRFRYAYRFGDDDSLGVRFQFRAVVPRQEDWPYEAAASRPVTVSGR